MKRKIAVVSEARATYGYIRRLMQLIQRSARLELQLIVTGMHLLKEYGHSVDEIVRDGFTPSARVDMYVGGDSPTAWSKSTAPCAIPLWKPPPTPSFARKT